MHRLLIALVLLSAPVWAQEPEPTPGGSHLPTRPVAKQQPPDAVELDVANHWQAVDLANKNLAAALGRLVEDRRKVLQELEAQKELSKQPKVSEAPK